MSKLIRRRHMLQAGLVFGVSVAAPGARACEFFTPHLRVLHPWTRATAEDAPFAVVCMRFDQVSRTDRLIGIETPVAAGAEIAGGGAGRAVDLLIPEGEVTLLGEAGPQLRLLGLNGPIEIARSYPLTLRFERAGELAAALNVDYARFR